MQHVKINKIKNNPAMDLLCLCKDKSLCIATAESCTGGLVGTLLTAIPGSSAAYLGGFVTYTNQMKIDLLGVDPAAITEFTEVSAKVAAQMAKGACERTGAQIGISLTGVAGPGGGSARNPVGTVYIGISTPSRTFAVRYCMPDYLPRHEIRSRAALLALTLAYQQAQKLVI